MRALTEHARKLRRYGNQCTHHADPHHKCHELGVINAV